MTVAYITSDKISDVLGYTWTDTDVQFKFRELAVCRSERQTNEELVGYHELVLNAEMYGKVRKYISEKVESHRQQKIIEFSIAE